MVGTKEAAPFAMKNADGTWIGISIDLWRRIAEEKKIRYRLVETETVPQLIEGVAAGKFDVAVAALTVTAAREEILDFSAPFYTTGLGIAVASGGLANWAPVFRALTSFNFLQSVLALIGLALLVGLVVWLFERRQQRGIRRQRRQGPELQRVVDHGRDDPARHRTGRTAHHAGPLRCDAVDGGLDHRASRCSRPASPRR